MSRITYCVFVLRITYGVTVYEGTRKLRQRLHGQCLLQHAKVVLRNALDMIDMLSLGKYIFPHFQIYTMAGSW